MLTVTRIRTKLFLLFAGTLFWGVSSCRNGVESESAFDFPKNWKKDEIFITSEPLNERKFVVGQMRVTRSPDILILGSSRSMLVDSEMFSPKEHVFNAGMSSAVIQDFMALWQTAKVRGKIPKVLILFVDPWVFNKNNGRNEWRENAKIYESFRDNPFASYVFGPMQATIQQAAAFFSPEPNVIPLSQKKPEQSGKRGDGTYVYPSKYSQDLSADEMKLRIRNYIQGCAFSMCQWSFHVELLEEFKNLLVDVEYRGTQVILILPPYEPEVYRQMSKDSQYKDAFAQVRHTLSERIRAEKNLKYAFCDFLNPIDVDCKAKEFIDGMHYRRSCTEKIIRSCVGKFRPNLLR